MRAGVILASGQSPPSGGREASVTPLAGIPVIRRVADRLTTVVDVLMVSCRDSQRGPIGVALARYELSYYLVVNPAPEERPTSGIRTALRGVERETDAEFTFVATRDMPFLDPELVDFLFERVQGHDAAIPRANGRHVTTHAVYRVGAMANACRRALARGETGRMAPLDSLDWVSVEESTLRSRGSAESLETVDTPEAFAAAERRLRGG